jgi:hypothetical protein
VGGTRGADRNEVTYDLKANNTAEMTRTSRLVSVIHFENRKKKDNAKTKYE